MKGGTVQISWHGSDPVLSVDFHPTSGLLATAGADHDIKLWSIHHVEKSKALPTATFKSNLVYHSSAVNVVRFSASGEYLASGADSGELVVWRLVQVGEENPSWKVWKILRFHLKDVLDLEWSRDGAFLVSASVDNTCIIWDVARGAVEQLLSDHQHYVQGVTWDPVGDYVVSLSSDRTCRFYSARSLPKKHKGKDKKEEKEKKLFECKHVLFKRDAGTSAFRKGDDPQKPVPAPKQYIFYDENMASFFRRLSWSPDGSFLLLPAGTDKQSPESTPFSVAYVVSRKGLSKSSPQPTLQLPTGSKPVMGVRFCPIYFVLKTKIHSTEDTGVPELGVFDELPYRLVFAVATLSSVFIYETQGSCPIAVFVGLHYAPITDIAWSPDGKFLAVSSQDGYCTLIAFDEGELGVPLPMESCKVGADINKTFATAHCVSSKLPHCSVSEDSIPVQTDGRDWDKVHPISPGHVNGTIADSADQTLNVLNSFKQKAKVVKMRRVCPKAITDSPDVASTSTSRASSCRVDTCSSGLHDLSGNQVSSTTSLSRQSAKSLDSPVVSLWKEREAGDSTSTNLEISPQGSDADCIPLSCPVFEACDTSESACRADKVTSSDGHATACSTKQIPHSEFDEARKPSEEFTDIYVRPLKYRRITPKPVCEEASPVVTC